MADAPSPKGQNWSPHLPAKLMDKPYAPGIIKQGSASIDDGGMSFGDGDPTTGTVNDR